MSVSFFRIMILFYLFLIPTFIINSFQISYKEVDQALQPYTNEYFKLLNVNCSNKQYNTTNHYKIYTNKLNHAWIGLCTRKLSGFNIQVDSAWWKQANDPDRYQLIFHEMAHCLISKDHVENRDNYMNPSFVPIWYNDLFDQATKDIKDHCNKNDQ